MFSWLLTASPAYLAHAMNEIKAFDAELTFGRPVELGVIPFQTERSPEKMNHFLRQEPPIFIRHICPIQAEYSLDENSSSFDQVIDCAVRLLEQLPEQSEVGIQIRKEENSKHPLTNPEIRETIAKRSRQDLHFVSKNPQFVCSIFLTQKRAMLGVSEAEANLSDWPGGAVRLRMEPSYPSRSRLKLEEAFQVFSLYHLDLIDALDIGAAPGGWTSFLLDQGFRVTAVDTGEISPSIRSNSKLKIIKENVHEVRLPADSFDLITCDMSWSPYATSQRIVDLAPVLREDGRAIVTIKLLHKKITKTIQDNLDKLSERYDIIACKQLFHNRDEVTVYLAKR